MIEDNTPTVTARRRKPTQHLRIRLETARRLQNLNAKTKARRQQSKSKQQDNLSEEDKVHTHPYSTAPRIPKIKKNQLSRPPPPEAKYRKRQRTKTWLPTHVFHAKRAHMTPAAQPLWRFAVPLSPTEKSYRPSHRARGARGAVAWDMSYMATILIEGAEEGLEGVLRGVGVDGEEAWGRKGRRWREGTRALQTWVFEQGQRSGAGEGEDGRTRGRPIAPVTLIRAAKEKKGPNEVEMVDADDSSRSKTKKNQGDRRKIFIRVHPSAFIQLWRDLLGLAKRQKPPVMVEDLRFDIGSIEVAGPGSTEALIAALQPYSSTGYKTPAVAASDPDSPEATWTSLLGVTNPSSLPQNALLAFPISDPRLRFPCQTLRPRSDEAHMQDQARLLASWPPDHTQGPAQLFDRPSRLAASRQLPSQKAINRRRTLAGLGSYPDPQPGDPQIPMIIFASRPSATVGSTLDGHSKSNSNSNLPGSWTVLLPWKCVLPVWYTVMYYPLSSGGNPRFGGLQEQQQLAFEAGTPWFPGDFPGTRAGWEWGLRERERIRQEWERRPKGRRVEFDRLDLGHDKHNEDNGKKERGEFGRGWACDWERLLQLPRDEEGNEGRVENEGERLEPGQQKQPAEPNAHPGPRPVENDLPQQIYQLRPEDAEAALAGYHPGSHSQNSSSIDRGALATVRISLVGRGTPTPRARIYRLPDEGALRQQWLRQATDRNKNNDDNSDQTIMTSEAVRWSGIESGRRKRTD